MSADGVARDPMSFLVVPDHPLEPSTLTAIAAQF